jgi:predicted AlkP superfamily phosphohydrolase/phosphomutase
MKTGGFLHHFFFDSARGGEHFGVFEEFYGRLDQFIGKIARQALRDEAAFLICSDHGFTSIITEVNLNRWLMENGYLKLEGTDGLKGIHGDSRAFCLDPSRIYLHREGRFARGKVSQPDCASLIADLRDAFRGITFNGQTVIQEIFLRDEIFAGDAAENGPDLYLLPHHGFDLKGTVRKESIFGRTEFTGMHTYDDAHLFATFPVDEEDMKIEKVANLICRRLR